MHTKFKFFSVIITPNYSLQFPVVVPFFRTLHWMALVMFLSHSMSQYINRTDIQENWSIYVNNINAVFPKLCSMGHVFQLRNQRNHNFIKFEFSKFNHSLRYCSYMSFYKNLSFGYWQILCWLLFDEGPRNIRVP
jgi:hypothetical protein